MKSIECANGNVVREVEFALSRAGVDLRRCITQGPFQGSPAEYVVINYTLDPATEAAARQQVGRVVGATIQ